MSHQAILYHTFYLNKPVNLSQRFFALSPIVSELEEVFAAVLPEEAELSEFSEVPAFACSL
jgi:hypothetical protein